MLKGSCCCGAVKFALDGEPSMMATCHCSRCRKVGASTFVFAKAEDFRLLEGEGSISVFAPESGYRYFRSFCSNCGTALGEIGSAGESFPIPANCFDDSLDMSVRFHEFVSEKPDWLPICDGAKKFDTHPVKT